MRTVLVSFVGPLRRVVLLAAVVVAVTALVAPSALPGFPALGGTEEPDGDAPGFASLAWMRLRGPPTVGLQVGHLDAAHHPEELASLRVSTGASAFGTDEVDLNLAVADALATRLRAAGVRVERLPATLPPHYRADALVSLHADASEDPLRRGYKSAHARRPRNALEPRLQRALDEAYLAAAPLPSDAANVSGAMLDYYAFAWGRYRHVAHRATPAVLVEMGYLTHPEDLRWLRSVDGPADALAQGVLRYLASVGRWHPSAAPARAPAGAPGGT